MRKRIRTIRKPVPQISPCVNCGNEFKYMRTLAIRKLCDDCDVIRKRKRAKAFREAAKSP
jgi:NMD protein affecting ribosome stability and mRNA decay